MLQHYCDNILARTAPHSIVRARAVTLGILIPEILLALPVAYGLAKIYLSLRGF